MLRCNKNGGTTGPFPPGKTRGKIGPWKSRDGQIFVALTQRRGDHSVGAWCESQRQATITFSLGALQGDRLADWSPGKFQVQHSSVVVGRHRANSHLFP